MSKKLSLVAAFDELHRNTDVLSAGIEQGRATDTSLLVHTDCWVVPGHLQQNI